MTDLSRTIADLLGVKNVRLSYFSSGDLSALQRVETDDGRSFIAKGGPAPDVEGRMLQKIAETGAPAPAVVASNKDVVIITEVEGRSGFSSAQADLGRCLARLHAATGPAYGFSDDYAFGKVAIVNEMNPSWVAFWRDNRLLNNQSFIAPAIGRRLEKLAGHLDDILPDTPQASLLHGDLWSGNVMSSGKRISAFIDPASYYGDGEVDLAMLNLFGQLDADFYASYTPLAPGYAERQAVYSLWPALVHLRLFGSGYASMVERFLSASGF